MPKQYTDIEKYEMLVDGAIFIQDSVPYRINFVPSWEEIQQGDSILMEYEEDGEPVSVEFDDIDINDPGTHIYRLVLSNP